jgi:hypothetical protein
MKICIAVMCIQIQRERERERETQNNFICVLQGYKHMSSMVKGKSVCLSQKNEFVLRYIKYEVHCTDNLCNMSSVQCVSNKFIASSMFP